MVGRLRRTSGKYRSRSFLNTDLFWDQVLILKDHLDAGKSAVEFWKWQEALEDPKPGKQKDGSEDPFQDLEVRMGMVETS